MAGPLRGVGLELGALPPTGTADLLPLPLPSDNALGASALMLLFPTPIAIFERMEI